MPKNSSENEVNGHWHVIDIDVNEKLDIIQKPDLKWKNMQENSWKYFRTEKNLNHGGINL